MPEDPIAENIRRSLLESIDIIKEHATEPKELLTSVKDTAQMFCKTLQEYENRWALLEKAPEFIEKTNPETFEKFSQKFDEEQADTPELTKSEHDHFYKQITTKIDGEESNVTLGDDSIICTMSTNTQVDPISKGPINKPCKNSNCNHVYDFDSIQLYIKTKRKGKVPCPYVGCAVKNIRMQDIVVEDD